MQRFFFTLIAVLWPLISSAQTYPDYTSTTVNDFSLVLSAEDSAAMSSQLDLLRDETGVEMVLVTLPRLGDYARNTSIETYATNLFDTWGIGDKTRNDGILVLILVEDRQMRIELGAGYRRDWDRVAQDVVDAHFLPKFREFDYPGGIKAGVTATIEQIARPFAANFPAPAPEAKSGGTLWYLLLGISVLGLIFFRSIADFSSRFKSCPSCGKKGGLRIKRTTQRHATTTTAGMGLRIQHCNHCGHSETSQYSISKRSSGKKSKSFGGGRSGGGGASGKW